MSTPATALTVSGSPHERGIAQGRASRDAIAAHTEALLSVWRKQGVIDPLAHRARLLRDTRFEAAIHLPHASNQHYLIADASLIVSLEASSEGVTEVPLAAPDRSLHTNHPLARGPRYPEDEENSVARLRSLDDRLARGTPTFADLQGALTSFDDARHPVCRLRSDDLGPTSFTTASMISALHGKAAPVEAWVSFGPPSQSDYQTFTLNLEHQR